jgi:hypothetical protein
VTLTEGSMKTNVKKRPKIAMIPMAPPPPGRPRVARDNVTRGCLVCHYKTTLAFSEPCATCLREAHGIKNEKK